MSSPDPGLLDQYIERSRPSGDFIPGQTPIRLQEIPFYAEEVKEALDSLATTYLVMGKKNRLFEEKWSGWLGAGQSVCVNSGTSAVLLAMMWLKFHQARRTGRDEILIPAVTWSTSLFPAMVVGLKPVLVDVDLDNLCVNSFAPYITDKTLAVLPVHLLGHACGMDRIMREAKEKNIFVIEDCCEAHGAKFQGKKVGTFGDISLWSYMFAHHITTVEGGMLSVNDPELADTLRMFRAHGWVREISEKNKSRIIAENPDIHPSFLFADIGLNVRPTEITASFGLHQLDRLDGFIEKRRAAFEKITARLSRHAKFIQLFPERAGEYLSPFAYPVLVREGAPFSKKDLQGHLENAKVETRPIEGSNLSAHPFMKRYPDLVSIRGELKNAEKIHRGGFFFGLNQDTDDARIEYLARAFDDFFKKF